MPGSYRSLERGALNLRGGLSSFQPHVQKKKTV